MKNKTIAILGAGKTGLSVYKHYKSKGYNIIIYDDNPIVVEALQNDYNFVKHTSWNYKELDFIVTSPGIALEYPKKHSVLEYAEKNNVKIYCDVELFIQENPQIKYIAVSGTNGKSTVTALIRHIFEQCGKKCTYAGNIGIPVFDIDPAQYEYIVLELSSYQLDLMNNIHFHCSLLLNIQEDHIDHHGTFENYKAVKYRVFENQQENDVVIIEQALLIDKINQSKAQKIIIGKDVTFSENAIVYKNKEIINYNDLVYLRGEHNYKNISFAYAVSNFFGLPESCIVNAIISFKGLKHRQNNLGSVHGITFVNDSKATNQESTLQALKAYNNSYLILGGVAKSDNLDVILPYLKKVKDIFLIGSSVTLFSKILAEQNIEYKICGDLKTATIKAYEEALLNKKSKQGTFKEDHKQSYIVLLSPACASFDQFKSFEERGDIFVDLFKNLH